MPSSKEDETAAAAQNLGSLSLDTSGKKDDEAEPTSKDGTQTKLLCSACGEKSNTSTLMKCRACKCVWYCDKKCQKKHWKEHKKECKAIKKVLDERGGKLDLGEELEVGPLEKLPPREECPICMRVLPATVSLHAYKACCGKTLCCGCNFQHQMKSKEHPTCAFCRTAVPRSEKEALALRSKRVERKDPGCLSDMALDYGYGNYGLSVDHAKCIELLQQSAGLGYPPAQYQLGNFHDAGEMGLQQNDQEALKYWEKAAEGGHLLARHNAGCMENDNGNRTAAMRHWRLSASGGSRKSITNLIAYFEDGLLHHGDLAETLQAMYLARAEMKSEDRDQYIKYLKGTGEYKAEYDL